MAVLKLEYREPGPDESLHQLTERIEEAEDKLRLQGWREMPVDVAQAAEKVYTGGINDNLTWFTKRGGLSVRQAKRLAEMMGPLTKTFQALDLAGTNFLVVQEDEDET
jgi:hypothetical protein